MGHGIEKALNIRIEHPVHLSPQDSDVESIQRIVLASPRPEPIGASRPAGLRRQPLSEPCMNLSAHTAPIRKTCRSYRYANERTDSSDPEPAFAENGWHVFCEP